MAPTTSRKGKGEGSGPSTRAASQRRGTAARSPTPPVTTRSQSDSAPSSARAKRSAARAAAKERPNKPKRARAADGSRDEEEEEEDASSRSTGRQEAAEASSSDAAEPAASSSLASTGDSSPLRCPCLPRVVKSRDPDGTEVYDNIDPAVFRAYLEEDQKYCAKLKRQAKLATLDIDAPSTCLSEDSLLTVRESAMKTVFQAAKFVVGLSSTVDGKPLARCSGFYVEWDSKAKVGKILTSGHLICTKYPSIFDKSAKREYASTAQVQVHFPNDTTVDAELLHYDNHYHIALFKVDVDLPADVPSLSSDVKHAQDVFLLGRDENLYLTTNYGRVLFENPGLDPNHCMYVNCEVDECGAGGLVISFDGRFIGMANPTPRQAFIPASIILRSLGMWKKFNCIPRLHLGLLLSAIKYLEPSHIEKISSKFDVDEGFIVEEVSEGSDAEKVGIKIGDIITCWDGKQISTTADLDDLLLGICEDHVNNGNSIGSKVSVTVGVFHIRKEIESTKQLPMKISDDVQVIARGSYTVSAREGPSAGVSSEDVAPGQETPHDAEGGENN